MVHQAKSLSSTASVVKPSAPSRTSSTYGQDINSETSERRGARQYTVAMNRTAITHLADFSDLLKVAQGRGMESHQLRRRGTGRPSPIISKCQAA